MNTKTQVNNCSSCKHSCFHDILKKKDYHLVSDNKAEMHFSAGDKILSQGGFVAQFAYLKEGMAKSVFEGENNRNTMLSVISADNYMPLSIIGSPDVYPFSVIALSDCKVCFIRKEAFLAIVKKNSKANKLVLEWNTRNNLKLYEKLHKLNTRNSYGKLAYTLHDLACQNYSVNIFKYLSRKDLAELSSISLESTNKIISQLKNDGIISVNAHGLKIERLDLIERLSTVG